MTAPGLVRKSQYGVYTDSDNEAESTDSSRPIPDITQIDSGRDKGFVRQYLNAEGVLRRRSQYDAEGAGRSSDSILRAAEERGARKLRELFAKSGPHFTVAEMAETLGWKEGRVREAIEHHRLYAVKDEQGQTLLPQWQVDNGDVVDGLNEVLEHLRDAGWMGDILFFESGHALLNGKSPADVLRSGGDIENVRRAAAREGRHGAA